MSKLFMAKGHNRYCGLVREKITISGIHNCQNYCEIFIVHTQLTNMAAGRIIQPGELRVGDPWSKGM